MELTFKNSSNRVTLENALRIYKNGVAVTINDGKDITLIIEKQM